MNESTVLIFGVAIPIANIPIVSTTLASIVASFMAIVVCVINNIYTNKKIQADIESNKEKIKADLFSQSSKTYKELITSERIKWLGLLRESMVDYLGKAHLLTNLKIRLYEEKNRDIKKFKKEINMLFNEFCRASHGIQLRLNPKSKKDKKTQKVDHNQFRNEMHILSTVIVNFIGSDIEDSIFDDKAVEIQEAINTFSIKCQELLKEEWEFVKEEANPNGNNQ